MRTAHTICNRIYNQKLFFISIRKISNLFVYSKQCQNMNFHLKTEQNNSRKRVLIVILVTMDRMTYKNTSVRFESNNKNNRQRQNRTRVQTTHFQKRWNGKQLLGTVKKIPKLQFDHLLSMRCIFTVITSRCTFFTAKNKKSTFPTVI